MAEAKDQKRSDITTTNAHEMLDKAITEFWRNHMARIKQARIERGEE